MTVAQEQIAIRHPNISDLEDIVHINRVSLPENYPVAYFIELIKSWKETSCVAELNDETVGYILMRVEGSSSSPWSKSTKDKGHIISVAVLPKARRKGIGSKMMKFVMKKAESLGTIKKITLEVRQSNLAAINMYRKLSFVSSKILKSYYSDGEDAVMMTYDLQ